MQFRILGKTGVSVSELCLGTMNLDVLDRREGKGYNDPQYPARGRVLA